MKEDVVIPFHVSDRLAIQRNYYLAVATLLLLGSSLGMRLLGL